MTVTRRPRPASRARSKAPSTRTAIVKLSDVKCGDTGLSTKITVKTHTRKFNPAKLPPRRRNGKWTQKRQLTLL